MLVDLKCWLTWNVGSNLIDMLWLNWNVGWLEMFVWTWNVAIHVFWHPKTFWVKPLANDAGHAYTIILLPQKPSNGQKQSRTVSVEILSLQERKWETLSNSLRVDIEISEKIEKLSQNGNGNSLIMENSLKMNMEWKTVSEWTWKYTRKLKNFVNL